MFGTITRRLRRIVSEPRTDGGVAAAPTPDTTPAPGIPPDDRRCPMDCDAHTDIVNVARLLESEDDYEWQRGTSLDRQGRTMAGRCRECGTVHTNIGFDVA